MTTKLTCREIIQGDLRVCDIGNQRETIPRLVIDVDLTDEEISALRQLIPQALRLLDLVQNTTIDMTQRERSLLDLLLKQSLTSRGNGL